MKKHIKTTLSEYLNENKNSWIDIHSTEFKNWFGDWENNPNNSSKVLNENGEPLVVYHGGTSDLIKNFKPNEDGIFFTDKLEVAERFSGVVGLNKPNYSKQIIEILNSNYEHIVDMLDALTVHGFKYKKERFDGKYGEKEWRYVLVDKKGNEYQISTHTPPRLLKYELLKDGKNYSAFLNIRNPFIYNAKGKGWDNLPFNGKIVSSMEISIFAKKNNYDGTIFYDLSEAYIKSNIYVVYDNSNIKIVEKIK